MVAVSILVSPPSAKPEGPSDGSDGGEPEGLALRQQGDDFPVVAAATDGDQDIGAADNAQIAMRRFHRMNEMARRAGAGQGSAQLARHDAGLAQASDQHSPAAGEDRPDRPDEGRVEPLAHLHNGRGLLLEGLAAHGQDLRVGVLLAVVWLIAVWLIALSGLPLHWVASGPVVPASRIRA